MARRHAHCGRGWSRAGGRAPKGERVRRPITKQRDREYRPPKRETVRKNSPRAGDVDAETAGAAGGGEKKRKKAQRHWSPSVRRVVLARYGRCPPERHFSGPEGAEGVIIRKPMPVARSARVARTARRIRVENRNRQDRRGERPNPRPKKQRRRVGREPFRNERWGERRSPGRKPDQQASGLDGAQRVVDQDLWLASIEEIETRCARRPGNAGFSSAQSRSRGIIQFLASRRPPGRQPLRPKHQHHHPSAGNRKWKLGEIREPGPRCRRL